MNPSTGRRAALAAAGGALAVAAIALPAYGLATTSTAPAGRSSMAQTKLPAPTVRTRAAGTRWRVYTSLSLRGRSVLLTGIDAVSRNDAWVAGISGDQKLSREEPLIEHWNGASWREVRLPRADRSVPVDSEFFTIGASSDSNAWAFSLNGRYLRLSGRRWTAGRIPGTRSGHIVITSAQVFSPADAWAFGDRFIGRVSKLDFVPYAARFNGTRWQLVPVPGRGTFEVSALSPRDMWALAGGTEPGTDLPSRARILHWNGVAWTREPVQPRLPRHGRLASIVALSKNDIWAGGSAPNGRGGTSELAVHWNGRSWTPDSPSARPSQAEYFLGDLFPDGHGGLWGLGEQLPGTGRFWHRSRGRWAGPIAAKWDILALAAVPHTRSAWGIAVGATKNAEIGVIIVHGPVPR